MLNLTNHQRSANQNHKILCYPTKIAIIKKTTNTNKDMAKGRTLYTVDRNLYCTEIMENSMEIL